MNDENIISTGGQAVGFWNEFDQQIHMSVNSRSSKRMDMSMERDDIKVFSAILTDVEGTMLLRSLNSLFCMSKNPNSVIDNLDLSVKRFYRTQIADGNDQFPGMVAHPDGTYCLYTAWQTLKDAYEGAHEDLAIAKKQIAKLESEKNCLYTAWQTLKDAYDGAREDLAIAKKQIAKLESEKKNDTTTS